MPVFTSLSQLATSPYVAEGMPRGAAAARPAPKRRLLFHFRGQILRRTPKSCPASRRISADLGGSRLISADLG